MKLYNSKKGDLVSIMMNPVFETVLALGVVGLLLFGIISTMKDRADFDRQFLSTDVALIIDTLYTMPEMVYLEYNKDVKNFSFKFDKNAVNVYEKDKQHLIAYFIEDKKTRLLYKTLDVVPVNIAFFKQGNALKIDYKDNINFNEQIVVCPTIKTKKSLQSTSFLLVSDESLRGVKDSLKAFHPTHESFYISEDTFEKIRKNLDIVIELKISQKNNELTIFYQAANIPSKILACSVSNVISANIVLNEVNLIPVSISYFQYNGKYASMSIKLPNNYPKNIASIINKGITKYFENE